MRELVESQTDGAPCLFLQGASGELAPAEQYVADTCVADRHGRCVGFAAMSALESMNPPGCKLTYAGVVESGAPLGVWNRQHASVSDRIDAKMIDVELDLKPMPTAADSLETASASIFFPTASFSDAAWKASARISFSSAANLAARRDASAVV